MDWSTDALTLGNDSAPSPSSSAATSPPTSSTGSIGTKKSTKLGPIIGGAVGGVACTLLVAGAVAWALRRKWSRAQITASLTSPWPLPPDVVQIPSLAVVSYLPSGSSERNMKKSEKRAPDQSTAALNGATFPQQEESPSTQHAMPVLPPSALPTEELVRLLNERLRGHQWDEEEMPPEYPPVHGST
ncbi:hypothetical protein DFH07DRAFT_112141 [Mycena maculata]|uniref:Transmembrane protein n=1 Tax=Mycena maculata TaxID=230809 RepID=A0AAD7I5A1_9AGAR|nr:hypothetical protein DFH07DRAFT_112141 [Mycena maculata]